MPNHVANRVTMHGITKLPLFTTESDTSFDFNKIIPMPESLNIESGGIESNSIDIALDRYRFNLNGAKEIAERHSMSLEQVKELGKKYLSNVVNYGFSTWYGWCSENWGTKWNSYDNKQIDENTIQFNTAWSYPEPVIKKLSEMYPDIEVRIQWSDEDTGCNTGDITYKSGEIICGGEFENCSNEAYEMYILLHGESNCLAKDENNSWYHKDCEHCDGC